MPIEAHTPPSASDTAGARAAKAIWVNVNDRPREVGADLSLIGLLEQMNLANRPGFAVAVNAKVVPRKDWAARILREGDRVLIIHASQGG